MIFRFIARMLLATALPLAAMTAQAQAFPNKPIRVVLPFSAGSGPDTVVRTIGEKMTNAGKGQLVVDNKPGANGWLAMDAGKRSAADGYSVLLVDNALMSLHQHIYKKMPYDSAKDFEPVTPLYSTYFFVVVPANSPYKSAGDLVAAARAKPGRMTYGTWGIGSVAHVGAAMLEASSGTQMSHVPFKEIAQLYTAVATGDVEWAFGSAASVAPLYRAGKVKLLAVAGPKRHPSYADVPTLAESGGPADVQVRAWVALMAPAGAPKPAVDYVNTAVTQALGDAELRNKLAGFGFEPWTGTPADVAKAMEQDSAMYARVVQRAKISLD
ncbi:MAG TPA: tripartite tricarboxylate transporter substrate binding protein [Ramlibacter sp.]|nr:tripartite tricarboxylate transporter substrate binding protein [Ramlibacter sp.]